MLYADPSWGYLTVRPAIDQALPNATPTAPPVSIPGRCRWLQEVGRHSHVTLQPPFIIFVIENAQYSESRQLILLYMLQIRWGSIMLDLAQIVQIGIPR